MSEILREDIWDSKTRDTYIDQKSENAGEAQLRQELNVLAAGNERKKHDDDPPTPRSESVTMNVASELLQH
jgi:hypothetical protein